MKNLIKATCRALRKTSTDAENVFWMMVRNRKLKGCKFIRQHPIKFKIDERNHFFIADFYCAEQKIVVEIDGKIHDKHKDYDKLRSYIIEKMGMKVVRFKNDEILDNIAGVQETLERILSKQ